MAPEQHDEAAVPEHPAEQHEERVVQHEKTRERQALSAHAVHEALRYEGRGELKQPLSVLAWSGLAAGLSMGLTLLAEGVLHQHLPDTEWRRLVTSLGYTVGFVAVTLGRQQLYTETTVTAVLPFLHERTVPILLRVFRLWTIVFLANMVGAWMFAWAAARPSFFGAELRDAFTAIGYDAMMHDPWSAFMRGIVGGWIIALMVWLLPSADVAKLWVIVLLTYVLAAAQLTHIVAGSVEAFYLVHTGGMGFGDYIYRYGLPVLLGNSTGGVVFVALLNHAQVAARK